MLKDMTDRSCICPPTPEERCPRGMWCTPEIIKAVEQGYIIVKIHEVWHKALSNIVWSRPERSGFSDCTRDVTFRWHYCSFGNEHGGDCVELPPELPRCTARSSFRKESWKLSSVQEFFGWWSSWIVTDSPPSKMLSYLTRCCFVELTFRGVHNIGRGCTENKQDMRAPYIYG